MDVSMTSSLPPNNSNFPAPFDGTFEQPALTTPRLLLEPIVESHAEELCELFRDPELHRYVPFEPLPLEKQRERCAKWARRQAPDGSELWLNWAARDQRPSISPSVSLSRPPKLVAHFQAGVKPDHTASIGYLVGLNYHRQGIAFEGLTAVFNYLRDILGVREIRAWSDTRNHASHRLAEKLGMTQVEGIKDADFFKGQSSDEFVFLRKF
jgi:[ribosomal protein S5]-alanine N-acetyltransferase